MDSDGAPSQVTGPGVIQALLEGLPDATVATSADGRIALVNAEAERLFGYAREEMIGRPVDMLWPPRLRKRYRQNMALYFATEHPLRFTREAHGLRRDGAEFVGEMSWGVVRTDSGPLVVAVGRDITARLAVEEGLRRSSAELRVVADLAERALGGAHPDDLSREAARAVREVLDADLVEVVRDDVEGHALEPASHERVPIGDGADSYGVLHVVARRPNAFGERDRTFLRSVANLVATAAARRRTEDQVRHQAMHDALTGLPNRLLCHDRLAQALATSRRTQTAAAVLYLDVDGFKAVNDTHGHAAGDAVLTALALRLDASVRPNDTVARVGGDEFVTVCADVDERTAVGLANRLIAAVAAPLDLGGARHELTASVGVALAVGGEGDPDQLIADADAAAYRAKQSGGGLELFDAQLRADLAARMRMARELENALDRVELGLDLQPIVALADGAVVGHEALLRWHTPPGEFLAVAEESGLIVPIGSWVLDAACRLGARSTPPAVSVNLSSRELADPELPDRVIAALERSGLAPEALSLEVPEPALVPAMWRALGTLRGLGVRVVLDQARHSLARLRELPVDAIKLDRALVSAAGVDAAETAIVSGFVDVGGALGLDVVAVGVEDAARADALRAVGCPYAQGFWFGTG